jgi:hypothetical protein
MLIAALHCSMGQGDIAMHSPVTEGMPRAPFSLYRYSYSHRGGVLRVLAVDRLDG